MPNQLEVWVFAAGLLVFWLFVHLLDKTLSLKKYGIKVSLVVIKYESERFKAFLYKASQKGRKLWKVFSNLSMALGAGLLIFAMYFLSENLLRFVQPGGDGSPVVPILPGLTIRVDWLPYFILAFLVAALTHEAAHGIIARVEGVNIKSAGLFFALVQPGGFVAPDEEELEKSSTASKMRVLSAGSSMNLLVGLLAFLAISLLFFRAPSGIVVIELLENGPIEQAGLQRWDVIFAVNGTRIGTPNDLDEYMANVAPGDQLVLSTSRGDVPVIAASHPEKPGKAIIGFVSYMLYYPSRLGLGYFWDTQLHTTLNWVFLLLVNLAIVNMLPIPLLDGDHFLNYFLQKYARKNNWIRMFFNAASLFLIATNMALSIESGFFPF
jgi:membrane-associated protease RseP (regulator of RpoE activity)